MKINWKCNSCDGIYESLDIRFTKACDNQCPFCIERAGLEALGRTDVPVMVNSIINSKLKNILIVGGEPFLNIHELYKFVVLVRKRTQVENIYITTSLPFSIYRNIECQNLFMQIMELITGLNISLQSVNSQENNQMLRASSHHNRIELLKEIISMGDNRDKIRVNLNLVKGTIDSTSKLEDAVHELFVMGVKTIKINELQDSPLYVSFEKLFPEIELGSPYSTGCQTDITKYFCAKYQDQTVLLKRSCFLVEKSKTATFADLVKITTKKLQKQKHKFGVLYEDGTLSSCWLKGQ